MMYTRAFVAAAERLTSRPRSRGLARLVVALAIALIGGGQARAVTVAPPILEASWETFVGGLRLGQKPPDGPFTHVDEWGRRLSGQWTAGQMHGAWELRGGGGQRIGRGDFVRGAGTWTGLGPNGRVVVEGTVERSAPHGSWLVRHASGRIAARGSFADGLRVGAWRYFHDVPGEVVLATGSYLHDETGVWEHYDRLGRHVASADTATGLTRWYDPRGRVRAVSLQRTKLVAGDPFEGAVVYDEGGRVTAWHVALDESRRMILVVGATGEVSEVLVRHGLEVPEGPVAVTLAGGRVALAVRADDGKAQRLTVSTSDAFTSLMDQVQRIHHGELTAAVLVALRGSGRRLSDELAQSAASPLGKDRKLVKRARELLVAAGAVQHLPTFAKAGRGPLLLPKCQQDPPVEVLFELCDERPIDARDPALQVQAALTRLQEFATTSGSGYAHLDLIAHRLMGFMPDRFPSGALPTWMRVAEPTGAAAESLGFHVSTWSPMLRSAGIEPARSKPVFEMMR